MKIRMVILFAAVSLLLVVTIAHAQPREGCVIEGGTAAGGSYRLTALAWQVSGMASGGEYHLLGPEAPALRGSGCCCTYLPLMLRRAH
ncbi:hypothetical protein ACFLT5_02015 [Chloroflexota bacterium]